MRLKVYLVCKPIQWDWKYGFDDEWIAERSTVPCYAADSPISSAYGFPSRCIWGRRRTPI